jgi:hypothetical protein
MRAVKYQSPVALQTFTSSGLAPARSVIGQRCGSGPSGVGLAITGSPLSQTWTGWCAAPISSMAACGATTPTCVKA